MNLVIFVNKKITYICKFLIFLQKTIKMIPKTLPIFDIIVLGLIYAE